MLESTYKMREEGDLVNRAWVMKTCSLMLTFIMLIGMFPSASAEEVQSEAVSQLMELFDENVAAPKEKYILDEPETMMVRSAHGNFIYVLSMPGGGKKLSKAEEGTVVTVYARQGGYSLGIVEETSAGGWMRDKYLVSTGEEPAQIKGKSEKQLLKLGLAYELGDGEKQDYAEAERLYKQAAETGSAEAMARLGWLYFKDFGGYSSHSLFDDWFGPILNVDHESESMQLLEKAAEKGNAFAYYALGCWYQADENCLYLNASAVSYDDEDLAYQYYLKAAELGYPDAVRYIDEEWYDGLNGEDAEEALEALLRQSRKNDPYAQLLLGEYEEDETKKEKYFKLAEKNAIAQKDAFVLTRLGEDALLEAEYSDSEDPGNTGNEKAFDYFTRAAKYGDGQDILRILFYLNTCEYSGEDYYERVERLVRPFLKKGNADELMDLGRMLHEMAWVEGCEVLSAECCLSAAEKGSIGGLLELSCLLIDVGMEDPEKWPDKRDPERVFRVFLDAAENGLYAHMCDGESTIVWLYDNGFGCKKDPAEAEKWAERIDEAEAGEEA